MLVTLFDMHGCALVTCCLLSILPAYAMQAAFLHRCQLLTARRLVTAQLLFLRLRAHAAVLLNRCCWARSAVCAALAPRHYCAPHFFCTWHFSWHIPALMPAACL